MGLRFEDGRREVHYRYIAKRNGVQYREFDAVGAPAITAQADAEVKTSIRGVFSVPEDVDWLTDSLCPYMVIDGAEYPLGEYVITSAVNQYRGGRVYASLEGYDQGVRVQNGTLDSRIILHQGRKYLEAIKEQLVICGIQQVIADPIDELLPEDRADWEIGESRLTLINALLAEINYRSLWFDSNGIARLTKYRQPSAELATKAYTADALSVIQDESTSSLDVYGAYNDWIVIVSNPDKELMIARASNTNPTSALSVQRIGRRTAPIIRLDNIASQDALQEYVNNVRFKGMASAETVTWKTANLSHEVGEIVILQHPQLQGVYEETGWTMTLQAGAEMEHTGKRVVYR